ncbi:radical SAM family heme chaperone HemW [soil metagenome]
MVAISKELILQRQYLENNKINTIYFGGGTPSLLDEAEITMLLQTINNNFNLSNDLEITLEANPDDLDLKKIKILKNSGINRLSIGIQTFSNEVLKYLNRLHNSQEAIDCISTARKVGFNNLNIDLIYGIPISGHGGWEKNLEIAFELKPDHISAYCLTIEPNTAFGSWLKSGKLVPVDEEYAALQFEKMLEYLKSHQYEQYEISNFSLPGKQSKHNINYWKQEKYLGIGPGAHSFNGITRQYNVSHNLKYITSLETNEIPFELDVLTLSDRVNEYIMTSLRTNWGCDFEKINNLYNIDIYQRNLKYLQDLIRNNLAIINENNLILTNKGKLFADKIASDLFVVDNF